MNALRVLLESLGSPDKSNNVGIDGPKMSVSKIPALNPSFANANDKLAATVLFPTPPFAEDTAMTLSTPVILRFCGFFGQCGGVPARGKPKGFSWAKAPTIRNRRLAVGLMVAKER